MSMLYGDDGLDDLRAAGHGMLTDPVSVFGLGADMFADPPAWLSLPAEVDRRIAAKPAEDGVQATHWPGVVELARCCADVADDVRETGAAPVEVIHRALTLSTALSRRLPRPPIPLVDAAAFPVPTTDLIEDGLIRYAGPAGEPAAALGRPAGAGFPAGHAYLLNFWQDRLREQACRLAEVIGDRLWTDPDLLAGIVDDTRRILAAYFVTAYELDALPAMPPPRRSAERRSPDAGHTIRRRSGVPARGREPGHRIHRHPH
jgi:hypothetical protein